MRRLFRRNTFCAQVRVRGRFDGTLLARYCARGRLDGTSLARECTRGRFDRTLLARECVRADASTQHFFRANIIVIGGWGCKKERSGCPHRESKPSAHAPAPHARHDRSMARSCLVARMIFEEKCSLLAARVQRPSGFTSFSVTLMKRFFKKS